MSAGAGAASAYRNAAAGTEFVRARDLLVAAREDYARAYAEFRWPESDEFNWALDYFDPMAAGNDRVALRIVDDAGGDEAVTFDAFNRRSDRVANFLRGLGVERGDRVLLMLPNVMALWELSVAAMKLGAVISPATTALARADLADRIERGRIRHVVADSAVTGAFADVPGAFTRTAVGAEVPGWRSYADADQAAETFEPDGPTRADDPLFLYFTSGTTARPKIVVHTHRSYPVGHLSTMYWIGLRADDVHLNISSPGWAKHAWSSFFAPWNAGATIFVHNAARFDARATLDVIARHGVTTLCAPPTVWRMLILEDLAAYPVALRELVSAGEPLNPEVIERVHDAWGLTIRDGYGQTETTAQAGNPPGQTVKPGSMGRPLPGYRISLLDPDGDDADEGEIALALDPRPAALMAGYADGGAILPIGDASGHYRTSDVARRDEDGYLWYVGRADDVFKSSDYRISPFELESVLIEHPAVAEAAVVPSPDSIRLSVPKAYVVLKPGVPPDAETARSILAYCRERLGPYRRIRRIEFGDLPKTISGKIRRVELRRTELDRQEAGVRAQQEFREEDLRAESSHER
jgi:acetyl-CoA synthetase